MGPLTLKEIYPIEVKQIASIFPLFNEGAGESFFDVLEKRVGELEASEPTLESFVAVKRGILGEQFRLQGDDADEGGRLERLLERVDALIPAIRKRESERFPRDYSLPVALAYKEIEQIVAYRRLKHQEPEELWEGFLERVRKEIDRIAAFILKHRLLFLEVLLKEGERGLHH